ncbi:hypothetical protein ACFL4X_00535 [Gemmatimonadota bacterium]
MNAYRRQSFPEQKINWLTSISLFSLTLLTACGGTGYSVYSNDGEILFENRWATLRVSPDGRNLSLTDKAMSIERLKSDETAFMLLFREEQSFPSSSVSLSGDTLTVRFDPPGTEAVFIVSADDSWIIFESLSINGPVDSLRMVNLDLNIQEQFGAVINASYDSSFAICVQALTVNINAYPVDLDGRSLYPADFVEAGLQFTRPGDSRILNATLHPQLPVEGNPRAAIIACPAASLASSLSGLETTFGLPHPELDGVWGKISDEVKISYIFVPITENDADEVIRYAKSGGFGYLVTHPFRTGGHFLIDSLKFPSGEIGLRKVVQKIHAAGLKAGLHSNTGGISTDDPYVAPLPDPGLATCESFELATDISQSATKITVTTSPVGLPDRYTYLLYGPGLHLRIGDEIIRYESYTTEQPYTFTGCVRGEYGTLAAGYRRGEPVLHLAEKWNHYTMDVNSPLLGEVTGRLADIINGYEFDWLYLDGAEILSAQGPGFYYVNRFIQELFPKIMRELMIQSSYVDNFSWHAVSRVTSNDFPFHAIRRYCEVSRLGTVKYFNDNLCPTELGWWGLVLNNPSHYSTLPEEIEYGCAKSIAFNKAISLQLYQKEFLDLHGRTGEILDIFKRYEELRLSNYFPERVKQKLRNFGYDFRLRRDESGSWYFRQVARSAGHYVHGERGRDTLTVINEFKEQPVRLRLRTAHVPADFDDSRNITLLDPRDAGKMIFTGTGALQSSLEPVDERTPGGHRSLRLKARNPEATGSSWAAHTLYYDDYIDLSGHRMPGLWVRGDSSGALLNLHIGCQSGISIDHYIDLDFRGWRYIELPRSEGARIYDYEWPYLWKHSLVSLRWSQVDRFAIYLNDIPPGGEVDCLIGPVRALHITESAITEPSISCEGRKIVFPGTLLQDEYMEYDGGENCRFFGVDGHLKHEIEVSGERLLLAHGKKSLAFGCESSSPRGGSAWITVFTEGERVE